MYIERCAVLVPLHPFLQSLNKNKKKSLKCMYCGLATISLIVSRLRLDCQRSVNICAEQRRRISLIKDSAPANRLHMQEIRAAGMQV